MAKLTKATPHSRFKVHLEYDDGVKGEVDLSGLVGRGVFAAWNDAAVFNAVTIGEHGQLRWTNDLELCADALYLQISGKRAEDLFPNLKAHADA